MIAVVIVVIQVVITAWGFNAIRLFERWTMPVVLAVMVVMTVVSAFHVNGSFAPSSLSYRRQAVGGQHRDDCHRNRLGHHMVRLRR